MKKPLLVLLLVSHIAVGVLGFGLGIYLLPILVAPPAPVDEEVRAMASQSLYQAEFRRDLQDSDTLHWGKGRVSLGPGHITLMGKLAPGPDYKLYLSPRFVETEADFNHLKSTMLRIGDVKTFDNFVVSVPPGTDLAKYNSVIIWCEAFGQFITAAKYR